MMHTLAVLGILMGMQSHHRVQVTAHPSLPGPLQSRHSNKSASSSLASALHLLHISDIHIDQYYTESTRSNAFCHPATFDKQKQHKDRHFGNPGSLCDSPETLISGIFQTVHEQFSGVIDGILWTGDTPRHGRDSSLPRREDETADQIKSMVARFQKAVNTTVTPVMPSIGNWDVWPPNMLAAGPNPQLFTLFQLWSPLWQSSPQHASITESFLAGGYYVQDLRNSLVSVISLNTLYFFADNALVDDCTEDSPGHVHLQWLDETLSDLRQAGRFAILIGHVPPVSHTNVPLYKPSCFRRFVDMSGIYSSIILSQYYGHTNHDTALLLVETSSSLEPPVKKQSFAIEALSASNLGAFELEKQHIIGSLFISPSIIPVLNPGLRMIVLEETASTSTAVVVEHVQHFLKLASLNKEYADDPSETVPFVLSQSCSTFRRFGMSSLAPADWTRFVHRLQDKQNTASADESTQHMAMLQNSLSIPVMEVYEECSNIHYGEARQAKLPPPLSPTVLIVVIIISALIFAVGQAIVWACMRYVKARDLHGVNPQRSQYEPIPSHSEREQGHE